MRVSLPQKPRFTENKRQCMGLSPFAINFVSRFSVFAQDAPGKPSEFVDLTPRQRNHLDGIGRKIVRQYRERLVQRSARQNLDAILVAGVLFVLPLLLVFPVLLLLLEFNVT